MSRFYNAPVIGVDISADFSMVAILAPNGDIYNNPFKVTHDAKGFNYLLEKIKKVEEEFSMKPSLFMEATGIYHLTLFYFLLNNKVTSFVINPLVTNCNKNKNIRKVKNDKTDAITIAKIGKFEDIKASNYLDINVYLLKNLCREYYSLVDDRSNIKKKLSNDLRVAFPGYSDVFSNLTGNTSLAILECYPAPKSILDAPKEDIIKLLKKNARKGIAWCLKTYNKLIAAAENANAIGICSFTFDSKIKRHLNLLSIYDSEISSLVAQIEETLNSDYISNSFRYNVELVSSIAGIGFITAVTIISEIGDITKFSKPKQLVAFFGLDPSVNQSGKFNSDRNKMSKRGTRIGRRALYAVALSSVRKKRNGEPNNAVLLEYYKTNLAGKKKKIALVAIMHKLMNYIFAVLRDQKPYVQRSPKLHSKMYLQNNSRLVA